MNKLQGTINNIISNESLSLVYITVNDLKITAIVIDTPDTSPLLQKGKAITVIFKETEVIIGTGTNHTISMQNKFVGPIISIESKALLSKLIIETSVGKITSIITTNAVKQLKLIVGLEVTAMVKTNEILVTE
ncbi:TOBE domain-containing protein [Lutibacter sp.]|jgi:molybdopterin-binding protein|uniref:TOBE domain-containing protein n=1 Tax=Lutibacter sp. TaxID=1925666 RepID=UPI001A2D950B|nr:TOBE domain-containing protein [Lutibacter sp.]MBI9041635.1 TOBE domain-containing protein [Lutibacter sp.]